MYTLNDDRTIEYGWMRENLGHGDGWVLDLGTPAGYPTQEDAISKGWNVLSIDLRGDPFEHPNHIHVVGDFNQIELGRKFDYVLNVSSIEHFGLAGRYGVTVADPDADIHAMEKLAKVMKPGAQMVLTIPVGVDRIFSPWHRVYGDLRFHQLIRPFTVLKARFWVKRGGIDKYVEGSRDEAFGTMPQAPPDHYYALGGFVLGVPPNG